jgi:hypothetical protein
MTFFPLIDALQRTLKTAKTEARVVMAATSLMSLWLTLSNVAAGRKTKTLLSVAGTASISSISALWCFNP